jgi:hypothetical protein
MNLTIGNTFPNTWKRIKTQYVLAICGAALAISAAVGVGAWQADFGGGSAKPASPAVTAAKAVPAGHTVYIVDSPEQRQAVSLDEMAAAQSGLTLGHSYEFVDSGVLGETGMADIVAAVTAHEGVQLVDLRGR